MQSIERVNLEKLKKCDQIWEDMIPTEKGRICAKCQNTIIDFRGLNDKQIAEIHVFSKEKVCGIYNKKQLILPKSQNKVSRFKSIYIGLIGLFSSINSSGQEITDSLKTEQLEPIYKNQTTNTAYQNPKTIAQKNTAIIFGRMLDKNGEALIGVSIRLKEVAKGCTSNIDGFYNLDITKELEAYSKLTLIFSYIGYATQEIVIDKEEIIYKGIKEMNITFLESMEGVTAFYVTGKAPLHKRIWYKVKRIFKK